MIDHNDGEEFTPTDDFAASAGPETAVEDRDETYAALIDQIGVLTKERDEAKESHLRLLAEFQNFRRQSEARAQQDRRFATEEFAKSLLSVVDNFDRTLEHLTDNVSVEAIQSGVEAVRKELLTAMERQGVTRLAVVGEPFDPEFHEAIATGPSEEAENTVLEEIRSGYRMNDRVIRPALVKVARPA